MLNSMSSLNITILVHKLKSGELATTIGIDCTPFGDAPFRQFLRIDDDLYDIEGVTSQDLELMFRDIAPVLECVRKSMTIEDYLQ